MMVDVVGARNEPGMVMRDGVTALIVGDIIVGWDTMAFIDAVNCLDGS